MLPGGPSVGSRRVFRATRPCFVPPLEIYVISSIFASSLILDVFICFHVFWPIAPQDGATEPPRWAQRANIAPKTGQDSSNTSSTNMTLPGFISLDLI